MRPAHVAHVAISRADEQLLPHRPRTPPPQAFAQRYPVQYFSSIHKFLDDNFP
jgi:hypothetical protein